MTLDKDRIGSLIVFIFCAVAWTFLDDMPAEAAFFPRLIVGFAMALSVIWGFSTLWARTPEQKGDADAVDSSASAGTFMENPRNFAVFSACLVAYIILIDTIGYFTSSALFVIGASLLLGYRRPLVVVSTAAAFVLFIYVVFVVIFERPLPLEFFQPQ